MSVNKEYQIVNLMRVTLFIAFILVVLFMILKFLWDSEVDSIAKFSAFFTTISSLGIVVTICGYIWQKKYIEKSKEMEKNELKKSIKKITDNELTNIDIDYNNIKENLISGHLDRCLSILISIDTGTLKRCAYDSAKINQELFYLISEVTTEVSEHKKLILENLNKENPKEAELIDVNILYCLQAIEAIESIHSSILEI